MKKSFIPEKLYKKIVETIPISWVDLSIKKRKSFLLVERLVYSAKNQNLI
jgi:hypothetical protein